MSFENGQLGLLYGYEQLKPLRRRLQSLAYRYRVNDRQVCATYFGRPGPFEGRSHYRHFRISEYKSNIVPYKNEVQLYILVNLASVNFVFGSLGIRSYYRRIVTENSIEEAKQARSGFNRRINSYDLESSVN